MLELDSPMSLESLERLVGAVALTEQDTVLDIGCGRGVLLKLLHEAYGCGGIGIDTSAERLDQARTLLSGIGSIELLDQDVTTFEPGRRFSLVSCLGTWFGGPDAPALLRFAEAEGQLLYGAPFWRKPPDAAYAEGFGTDDSERDFRTLADTISRFHEQGFSVTCLYTNTQQESDHYQSRVWAGRTYASQEEQLRSRLNYVNWIREYHGWGAWLLAPAG